jgi:transposase
MGRIIGDGPAGEVVISLSNLMRIVRATKPIDFRKVHDGLAVLVKNELHKGPFTGTVFVLWSRRADRLTLRLGRQWVGDGLQAAGARHIHLARDHGRDDQPWPCVVLWIGGGLAVWKPMRRWRWNSCGKVNHHVDYMGKSRVCLLSFAYADHGRSSG